ncbi:hypothetical protein CS022_03870 [Veronia nyctiphanis]|uniref:Uncharacterized protein n=1 Tax=Veronia nyctiphanis TaxID=1278244 RepID=A0A4Q0YSS0_9GAMM|nr:hypothetical protein [Veronia nyctiphanis]RXJ74216.1 hypothetical protein CS022_03870 [Veronia nyctiphanis]
MGTKNDRLLSKKLNFDYSHFLCREQRDEQWYFSDILSRPIKQWLFDFQQDSSKETRLCLEDSFYEAMSPQFSDVDNISRLIDIARRQGIDKVYVKLPYPLDDEQIQEVSKNTTSRVSHIKGDIDTLSISILPVD